MFVHFGRIKPKASLRSYHYFYEIGSFRFPIKPPVHFDHIIRKLITPSLINPLNWSGTEDLRPTPPRPLTGREHRTMQGRITSRLNSGFNCFRNQSAFLVAVGFNGRRSPSAKQRSTAPKRRLNLHWSPGFGLPTIPRP